MGGEAERLVFSPAWVSHRRDLLDHLHGAQAMKSEPITMYDIEDLHAALFLRYGNEWVRKWEHIPDMPKMPAAEAVRRDWLGVLDNYSKEALWYGLKNLPAARIPPNAEEFKAICRGFYQRERAAETKRIDGPRRYYDAKKWKDAMRKMGEIRSRRGSLDWAYELQERQKRGDILTEGQLHAMKRAFEAKAAPPEKIEKGGEFKGVPFDEMPEAMREFVKASRAEKR
jgi:hypothetical protein